MIPESTYPHVLRAILFTGLFLLFFLLLRKHRRLNNQIGMLGIWFLCSLAAGIVSSWIVLYQTSSLPANTRIIFTQIYTRNQFSNSSDLVGDIRAFIPGNTIKVGDLLISSESPELVKVDEINRDVGDVAIIHLQAAPKPNKVFILIHPHNTQFWYVQSLAVYLDDEGQTWEGVVYFSAPSEDCGLKYDLIALASTDPWIVEVFRGRNLYPEMKLDYLPVLNQSAMFTVRKKCGQP